MLCDYMFEFIRGENEGEQIFVECYDYEDPWAILKRHGWTNRDMKMIGIYSPAEAEIIGLDTY